MGLHLRLWVAVILITTNIYTKLQQDVWSVYTNKQTQLLYFSQLWGLLRFALIGLWQSLSAAAHLLESLLFTCTSKSSHRCSWWLGLRCVVNVVRLLFRKQRVWQCSTYDRSCVSLLSNRENVLTLNVSSPGQAHEIGVHSQRQIMGQQLPTRRLSTVSIWPIASSIAVINI